METYKINIKRQFLSYLHGFIAFPTYIILLVIVYYLGNTDSFFDTTYVLAISLFHITMSIPAVFLHIQYYQHNKGLVVEIDRLKDQIIFNSRNAIVKYKISELITIRRIVQQEFKYVGWDRLKPLPWLDYGYIRIETKDKKTFYLTSLMIDPLSPPIEIIDTKYKVIPTIEKSLERIDLENQLIDGNKKDLIVEYKSKYRDLSLKQIEEIAIGIEYQEEARFAAKELIKEKTATNKG